jgi:hypothetical protein
MVLVSDCVDVLVLVALCVRVALVVGSGVALALDDALDDVDAVSVRLGVHVAEPVCVGVYVVDAVGGAA